MYPFLRMFKEMARARRMPELGLFDTHVSHHICWPWDLDPWVELNNGRTLTLYDLGRLPLGSRTGIHRHLIANRWGMTVAGSSVRASSIDEKPSIAGKGSGAFSARAVEFASFIAANVSDCGPMACLVSRSTSPSAPQNASLAFSNFALAASSSP